jgi:hypothetical protein
VRYGSTGGRRRPLSIPIGRGDAERGENGVDVRDDRCELREVLGLAAGEWPLYGGVLLGFGPLPLQALPRLGGAAALAGAAAGVHAAVVLHAGGGANGVLDVSEGPSGIRGREQAHEAVHDGLPSPPTVAMCAVPARLSFRYARWWPSTGPDGALSAPRTGMRSVRSAVSASRSTVASAPEVAAGGARQVCGAQLVECAHKPPAFSWACSFTSRTTPVLLDGACQCDEPSHSMRERRRRDLGALGLADRAADLRQQRRHARLCRCRIAVADREAASSCVRSACSRRLCGISP